MNSVLVLLTSALPFQSGEEFLVQETKYYDCFTNVYIIPIGAKDFSKRKQIPREIKVFPLSSLLSDRKIAKTAACFKALFSKNVRAGLRSLIKTRRLRLGALRQLLVNSSKIDSCYAEIELIIKRICTRHSSEKIVLYSYWMANHAEIAVRLKKEFPGLKVITRCHGGDLYEYRYKSGYIPFRDSIMKSIDVICPISENGKQYIESTYPTLKAPVVVSRLGTQAEFRRSKLDNSDGLNIISCSYCIPLKRIDLIIRALSKIKTVNISWTHIGNGSEFDTLQALAAQILPSNIKYEFCGYVENLKIQELYASGKFNLFINVSETEGIPVSIMEAMSYGMPIIATDVGGVSEMVCDGTNGFLLPKDFRTEELINRILEFNNMGRSFFQAMSDNSHRIWKEKFNAQINYPQFVDMIRAL